MENFTTQDLITQLQEGSLDALGELYDHHNRMVYRTALAILGDVEAAADMLQEVFLRLFRFADRIDPLRPIEPWLYRVTANLSYTWVKRRRWQQSLEDITEWISGDGYQHPDQTAERDEEWQEIEKAIQSLTLNQRTVIILYYINDCSLEEISKILEVPIGTVKSRLHYGRRTLKKKLDRRSGVMVEVQYEFT